MKKYLLILFVVLTCFLLVSCNKNKEDNIISSTPEYNFIPKENIVNDGQYYQGIEEIYFPNKLWNTPLYERAPQYDRQDYNVNAYFFQSVDYEGSPTYVFAYVGIPDNASKDNPVPGVVLVHGGGGTAFADWVKMWNDRGYAAIAIDTEGKIPYQNITLKSAENLSFESIKHHGPINTSYKDSEKPVNQQYLYHAIAGTIAAHSFLSSFEEVESSKIGLTGISWGGVISTNVAAYDDRFAFVAPVYGAVGMSGTSLIFGDLYNSYPRCAYLWDNIEILRNCKTPILFINWEGDPFFSVDSTLKCSNAAMNAWMLLIPDLKHGHWQGANIEEIFTFANTILQKMS